MFRTVALVVSLLFPLPSLMNAQTAKSNFCEAPAEIEAAIQSAMRLETTAKQEQFQSLLSKYPGNFWIERSYIDARKNVVVPDEVIAEFRQRYDAKTDDPETAYLYAYTLIAKDTSRTIEILKTLTEKAPSFPMSWLTLANLHTFQSYSDRSKTQGYLEGYFDRCPDSINGLAIRLVLQVEKSEKIVAFTKALRERISAKADAGTVSLYSILWTLEFKFTPVGEHTQLRQRVENDLKFLEGLDRQKFAAVGSLLARGYQLTGNQGAREGLPAQAQPDTAAFSAFTRAQQEWSKANPEPSPFASHESLEAYYKEGLRFIDEWMTKVPQPVYLTMRLAILSSISDIPDDTLVREGEKLLQVSPSATPVVARAWAGRGIQVERVAALVKGSLKEMETDLQTRRQSDLYTEPYLKLREEDRRWSANVTAWPVLVLAYSRAGRFAEARSFLADWELALDQRRKRSAEILAKRSTPKPAQPAGPGQPADPTRDLESNILASLGRNEAAYYEALGVLASAEKRKLDALTYYELSLKQIRGMETERRAYDLWKELGGTTEGWQALSGSLNARSDSPRWPQTNRSVPDFTVADRTSKTWTLANLKGKTTLINVWATWCGPCLVELPQIQRLFDQVKDRQDIQVITLNVDENPGLVEPFLKQNNYTFPSLFARSFVDDFAGPIPIPTTWISDATATIRLETVGYSSESGEWVQNALSQIEGVRDGKVQAAAAPQPPR